MTTTAEWRKWNALNTKPITKGDLIRHMTDEELAEWLSCNCTGDGYGNSAEDWLDWLRKEVDDDNNS